MNTLYTSVHITTDPSIIGIDWQLDDQPCERLNIKMEVNVSDPMVAAELAAIHHLLLVRQIAGQNRGADNLIINCHHGAIKKLHRGRSSKKDLIQYAQFLRTRFASSVVKVKKSSQINTSTLSPGKEDIITLTGPLEYRILNTSLGEVCLSYHVLDRYMTRSGCISIENARKKVHSMMISDELSLVNEPEEKVLRNYLKHRTESKLYSYRNWLIRLVFNHSVSRIMTIFQKEPH